MVFYQFEYPRALAFPGFGMRMLAAELGQSERIAHVALHRIGKGEKVTFGRTDPV